MKDFDKMSVCGCVGPKNGQPLCPCRMRGVEVRDGRYVLPARDLGPVTPKPSPAPPATHGCVCPPGSEKTCQGPFCPRRSWGIKWT